jgi:hypothetical protein
LLLSLLLLQLSPSADLAHAALNDFPHQVLLHVGSKIALVQYCTARLLE